MDTEDFDSLMDWCDQLNFQNRDNRHIVPLIKTKMRETFLAYTHALSEREEKVSLGEALHELALVTVVREAERVGLDPERTMEKFMDMFEGLLKEIGKKLEDIV